MSSRLPEMGMLNQNLAIRVTTTICISDMMV
jgi:hypothetical protein